MSIIYKVKGKFKIDAESKDCKGEIEIVSKKKEEAYVTWRLFDETNSLVASVSRNYFFAKEDFSDECILQTIFYNISNYRIGRKKIFSNVYLV